MLPISGAGSDTLGLLSRGVTIFSGISSFECKILAALKMREGGGGGESILDALQFLFETVCIDAQKNLS